MGLVYSPEAVAEARVPDISDQYDAAQRLIDECAEWAGETEANDEPHPRGWMVYGSVAKGEATRRSDVDLLVVFDRENEVYIRRELFTLIESVQVQFTVFVEHNLYSVNDARAGRHNLDRLFVGHLLEAQRHSRWSAGKPASHFNPGGIGTETLDEVREIIMAYTLAKTQKFSRAKTGSTQDLRSLQRAFELPAALERKFKRLADLMDMENSPSSLVLPSLIANNPPYYGGLPNVDSHLNWLVKEDREYSGLLELVLDGQMKLQDYIDWLEGKYEESIDHALRLSLGVLALLDSAEPEST